MCCTWLSGAYANPKNLSDAFRKFIEYDKKDETNTVAGYIDHEYRTIANLRAPRVDGQGVELAPEDRFFTYKHYLDGNGELIDPVIMLIIAKAMVRLAFDATSERVRAIESDQLHALGG